jgi:hypothetical protein
LDFAIFVSHKTKNINGKTMKVDISGEKTPLFLIYIADTFTYPERLVHAIEIGITMTKALQTSPNPLIISSLHKYIDQINDILDLTG